MVVRELTKMDFTEKPTTDREGGDRKGNWKKRGFSFWWAKRNGQSELIVRKYVRTYTNKFTCGL